MFVAGRRRLVVEVRRARYSCCCSVTAFVCCYSWVIPSHIPSTRTKYIQLAVVRTWLKAAPGEEEKAAVKFSCCFLLPFNVLACSHILLCACRVLTVKHRTLVPQALSSFRQRREERSALYRQHDYTTSWFTYLVSC